MSFLFKLGQSVTTYIPRSALDSVRTHGLLSGEALLKNPDALAAAASGRGLTPEEFQTDIQRILKGWKPDSARGPNVVFKAPPASLKLHDKHPLRTMDLLPIRVRLSQLLKDVPATRVHGQELMPYAEYKKKWTTEQLVANQDDPSLRHRDITGQELAKLKRTTAARLWQNYADPDNRGMYAPDVPHAAIVTPDGIIPSKYLRLPLSKTSSWRDSHYLLSAARTPINWNSGQPWWRNLLNHLQSVQAGGQERVNTAYNSDSMMQNLDTNYRYKRLGQSLAGEDPVLKHPLDRTMTHGLKGLL